MKKIMFFAAVAAVVSLASCQKEALNEVSGIEPPVFTATISAGSKTTVTVNATDGKVAWESADKITITDASAASAIYKIKSIDGNTGKATFEVESGTLGQGPYTATYGTEPATAQTYAATPRQLYMTASSETTSLTFTVQCALMEINLTKAGESVKSIAVTGTPTGESETTYTLTCTDAQSIAVKKSFYIALPAGSYNKIVITDSNDKVCTLTAATGLALENNHIKPVTFGSDKLNFKSNPLPGVFTVDDKGNKDPSDDVKVYFSKGNLQATYNSSTSTYTFDFAANQNVRIGNAAGNTTIGSQTNGAVVDLFGWSTTAASNNWGIHTKKSSAEGFTTGNFKDWGEAYCKSNGITPYNTWRTLSIDEWAYLFNNHSYKWASVNGVNGYVIAPDGFASTLSDTYKDDAALTDAGNLIFLPTAGDRSGSSVNNVVSNGHYWSSSERNSTTTACYVNFSSDNVSVSSDTFTQRSSGFSVRLITECQ